MTRTIGATTATGLATGLALLAWAGWAGADPVQVTITAPASLADVPVMWEAVPADPAAAAGGLPAGTDEPLAGPWVVSLEPGPWQVSGFTEAEVLFGEVTVAATPGQSFEIAVEPPPPPSPYRCPDVVTCHFTDAATLIGFDLPQGWAADQPYVADLGGGEMADRPTAVFYREVEGEGGEAWFLNPEEWYEELGPCRETALGNLCTTNLSPAAEAAFAVIAPSLRPVTAEEAAAP